MMCLKRSCIGPKGGMAMLEVLKLKNFAIAEEVTLNFSKGFNVITGETGAGKSIILNAISMIMGDRADSSIIRKGEEEAIAEAVFITDDEIAKFCKDNGLECAGELIVRRIFKKNGKNSVFVNDNRVTLLFLKKVMEKIIDLNNQNEHQMLMNPENHKIFLDYFGDYKDEKNEYISIYMELNDLIKRYENFKKNEKELRRRYDNFRFEFDEIGKANLKAGEEEEIEKELKVLENAKSIRDAAGMLFSIVEDNDAFALILEKIYENSSLIRGINEELDRYSEEIDNGINTFLDAIKSLKNYTDELELDEERLYFLNERLALIEKLKRKYGDTIEDILAYKEKIGEELEEIEKMSFDATEITKEIEKLKSKLLEKHELFDKKKRETAVAFEKAVENEFKWLNMEKSSIKIKFLPVMNGIEINGEKFGVYGNSEPEFFIETNRGEGFYPLVKIASGGELSRVLFSIKSVISDKLNVKVIIFDEIDSGIGGETAKKLAKKLKELSKNIQVIAITHQPQIAAVSDIHYFIEKKEKNGRIISNANKLNYNEHIKEIARMISGDEYDEHTIATAEKLCNEK